MEALLVPLVLEDQAAMDAAKQPALVGLLELAASATVLVLPHYTRDAAVEGAVTLREQPATAAGFLAPVLLQGREEFLHKAPPAPETALVVVAPRRFLEAV